MAQRRLHLALGIALLAVLPRAARADAFGDLVAAAHQAARSNQWADIDEYLERAAERLGARGRVALALGGPRIDHRLAVELGYDAGFGAGTRPSDVASWLVGAVLRRMGKEH